MATVEPPRPDDVEDIRRISQEVFGEYGDYERILPKFFATQGVTTYVARIGPEVVGFVMVGFLPWSQGDSESDPWIAELLAIAVQPARQGEGIGAALMSRVFELVEEMAEWRNVREVQATCATSNQAGLRFFSRHRFEVINSRHGSYSGGQPALRLARRLG